MHPDWNILVVDDNAENLLILEDLLAAHFRVSQAADGSEALHRLAHEGRADLVLLDVVMPGMDGYETCRRIKADPVLRDIPVLFLTSLDSAADEEYGLSLGAADFIHKPFSPPVVLARVRNHLLLAQAQRRLRDRAEDLEQQVVERTRQVVRQSEELVLRSQQLSAAQGATIEAFCALAEARDTETGNHIRRTQHYVLELAGRLRRHPRFSDRLDEETVQLMFRSAPLHDVGKVAIPDRILLKPGRLDREEWAVMQSHCRHGRDAILQADREGNLDFLRIAGEIAYSHHERWDGSGYPEGLAGEEIPLGGRLMAVADVYDALISRRPYKASFSHEQAMALIAEGAGSHFDPRIVSAALEIADRFRAIARRYHDAA